MPQPAQRSRAFYLDAAGEPFLVRFDAAQGPASGRAVLLVPPFGWDEVCSYRPRRLWARHLAQRGTAVLRLDLPGAGDSAGGPWDPGRLEAWTTAVATAAAWLAGETGAARRLTAVGLGLGGLLAWRAAAAGAPHDDLVLWGAHARGKALVREINAFSRLERSRLAELNPGRTIPEDDDGALTAAGFVLAPETIDALGTVDLAELPLPEGAQRRILLLGRDGTPADDRLRAAAEATGAEVAVDAGPGWGAMVDEPQVSVAPRATIERVDAWLAAGPAGASPAAGGSALPAPPAAGEARIATDAGPVREWPIHIDGIDGIVTEPVVVGGGSAGPPALTLVLLNAGSIRRIGPNRMWVELARRWAARGVVSVRLDLPDIGEADGTEAIGDVARYYQPRFVTAVRAALDAVQEREGARRFATLGLCSGGYWSLHTALEDDRVAVAYLLNTPVLVWDAELEQRRDTRKLGHLTRASTYRRVLRGDIPLRRGAEIAAAIARHRLRRRDGAGLADPVDDLLDRLRDAGTRAHLVFTGDEPLHDELERSGRLAQLDRWPNLSVETLDELRDVHTLQPRAVQRRMHERIDAAIERDLRS